MLTVAGLSKAYKNKTVFNNINLEFLKGIYVLLAPNGEGKTTLIKLLTAYLFISWTMNTADGSVICPKNSTRILLFLQYLI